MIKKIVIGLLGLTAMLAGLLVVTSASAAPVVPKAYGLCLKSNAKGAARVLEVTNLLKSQYGVCAKGEVKILIPSLAGLQPAKMVERTVTRATETVIPLPSGTATATPAPITIVVTTTRVRTCKKDGTSTVNTWVSNCANVTTRATATPSPSVTPTP